MGLLRGAAGRGVGAAALLDTARRLDRFYILTRYPNGFDRGAPREYFGAEDSSGAIADADRILEFCARHVS